MKIPQLEDFVEVGLYVVSEDRREDWKAYAEKITIDDFYAIATVKSALMVMIALSDNKAVEEVQQIIYDSDLSGAASNALVKLVNQYHPRGEEFNTYWKKGDPFTPDLLSLYERIEEQRKNKH